MTRTSYFTRDIISILQKHNLIEVNVLSIGEAEQLEIHALMSNVGLVACGRFRG